MLTPIDIQNHSLKTAVRGYSKKETDDFLEEILKGYEELYKENRELKDKMASLSEGIQYYKQMETTLQKALVLAEKTSTETQEAAKSKAEALTSEAQTKADAVMQKAEAEAEALRKEAKAYADIAKSKANQELEETRNHVRKLVQSYENYRLQFKKLAESQIEMLESENYSIFAPELSEMLDEAPNADEAMDAERTEAINQPLSEENAPDDVAVETEETVTNADLDDTKPFILQTDENPLVSEEKTATDAGKKEEEPTADTLEAILEEELQAKEELLEKEEAKEAAASEWQSTTSKLEGMEEVETSSVMPNSALDDEARVPADSAEETEAKETEENTPFTFIDTE